MNTSEKTILVVGATGQQGGAAAKYLLEGGWKVKAFTRNPSSNESQKLINKGAEITQGDLDDAVSLKLAMRDVYGVFSVLPNEWDLNAADKEIRQGKRVADAAKEAGVSHFVFSSMGGADKQAGFRKVAKWEIETYIKSIGLQATVLRPPFYMENYVSSFSNIQNGILADATVPDETVKLIAVDDIGVFVKLAFIHPEIFIGKTIELAGDALTPPDIAAAISRAAGHPVTYAQIPIDTVRAQNEIMAKIYEWINNGGYVVDIPALRVLHPGLLTFEAWLEKEGKARFEAFFRSGQPQ